MTNNLTAEMTRLCGEIADLRRNRDAFIGELAREKQETQKAVARLVEDYRTKRVEMAAKTKDGLCEFVSGMKNAVADLCKAVASDLAGARQVWTELAAEAPTAGGIFEESSKGQVSRPRKKRR